MIANQAKIFTIYLYIVLHKTFKVSYNQTTLFDESSDIICLT